MSRANTGRVEWRRNVRMPGTSCWHVRYTRGDKSKTGWIPIDPSIPETDKPAVAEAIDRAVEFILARVG